MKYRLFLLFFTALFSINTFSAESEQDSTNGNFLQRIDNSRHWLSSKVEQTGQLIDSIFSLEDDFDNSNGSRLDILLPVTYHEDGQYYSKIRFRTKVELPNLNKRWNLIVSSTSEQLNELFSDDGPTQQHSNLTKENEDTGKISLQYKIKSSRYALSLLDAGVSLNGINMPSSFVRIKGHYIWLPAEDFKIKTNQNLFYRSLDGVGLTSRLRFDYELNDKQLFRSQTTGTWLDDTQNYDLQHNFAFYDVLTNNSSFAYLASWNWQTEESDKSLIMNQFAIGTNWRKKIYKSWLFFSIKPQVQFFKETNFYQPDLNVTFELEARFYK